MLNAYYGNAGVAAVAVVAAAAAVRDLEFVSPDAELEFLDDGVVAFARPRARHRNTSSSAYALCGQLSDDGSVQFFLIEPAAIGSGGADTIAAGWNYGFLQITDGEVTLNATTILYVPSAGLT